MDDAYEPPLLLSPDSVAGVFRTAHTIFPHLSVMKVNIVNLRKPLVSPTVQDLTLFIDRPTYGDNNRLAAVSLRRTAHLVPNVVTLRSMSGSLGHLYLGFVRRYRSSTR